MSHYIQFDARAFKVPTSCLPDKVGDFSFDFDEPYFHILLVLGGDNNVIDFDNKVARSWSAVGIDRYHRVMQNVVRSAASCEGGMMRLNGRNTKPENYIIAMRKVMDEAQETILPGQYGTLSLSAKLDLHQREIADFEPHNRRVFDRLLQIRQPDHRLPTSGLSSLPEEWSNFHFDLSDPEDLSLFIASRGLAGRDPSHLIKVTTPRVWNVE